ncbi:MAG: NusG domain II-containing protein [Defluviitaleaceae bacterium]|nr:NusG domain II-containing protein [Defluviitaleaceae bacterium]
MTKILRKTDVVVIAAFIVLAVSLLIIFVTAGVRALQGGNVHVIITIDGVETYVLDAETHNGQSFTIHSQNGTNTIFIQDGVVEMICADCPDLVCVRTAPISRAFRDISCLPHRVSVRIESREPYQMPDQRPTPDVMLGM